MIPEPTPEHRRTLDAWLCPGSFWAGRAEGINRLHCSTCDMVAHTKDVRMPAHQDIYERPDDGLVDQPIPYREPDPRIDSTAFPMPIERTLDP